MALMVAAAFVASTAHSQDRPAQDAAAFSTEIARLGALTDAEAQLDGLDKLLKGLDTPSPSRAYVQYLRAGVLFNSLDRAEDAQIAVDEALQLAPDTPAILLLASDFHTWRGNPGLAADLWMRASKIAPDLARQVDSYTLKSLLERLNTDRLSDKADALLVRMIAVGHPGADTGLRTEAAAARVRLLIDRGEVAGATEAMHGVLGFDTFLALYTDRRFEAIWPAMDRWTGGDLSRQHDASLRAERSDWKRNGLSSAAAYASSLTQANAASAALDLFLPSLNAAVAEDADEFYRALLANSVAGALRKVGRADEAVALLSSGADAFDPGNPSPGLTARASLANLYLSLDRFDDAIAQVDQFEKDSVALNGTGNKAGLAATEVVRACAAVAKGGGPQARDASASMLSNVRGAPPSVAWQWYSCVKDRDAARQLVLDSLDDRDIRSWALGVLQPTTLDIPGEWVRGQYEFKEGIRSDPHVREAANRVGRLLETDPTRLLPPTFDPKG